jgi:hypothetical protein
VTLKLNTESAKQADNIASSIRESGKYVGVITRAERLSSTQGTEGLGLSFRASDGSTADYLDIYTTKSNGEALMGAKTVNALLACLKLREVKDGRIRCEKWNKEERKRETVEVDGYPDMMGKRIGLLLQKELGTHHKTGEDTEKMTIFSVFSADTELTASEILDGKTNPERLPKMVDALAARPVRDNRDKDRRPAASKPTASRPATGFDDMDDDIPF